MTRQQLQNRAGRRTNRQGTVAVRIHTYDPATETPAQTAQRERAMLRETLRELRDALRSEPDAYWRMVFAGACRNLREKLRAKRAEIDALAAA